MSDSKVLSQSIVLTSTKVLPKIKIKTDELVQRLHFGSRSLASPLTISGLLTLLSKCFSTFPQGTCLLSISRQYLAMDGGYHPICALLPKSVTQSISTVRKLSLSKTGLSPSLACLSRHLRQKNLLVKTMMYNSVQRKATPIRISG